VKHICTSLSFRPGFPSLGAVLLLVSAAAGAILLLAAFCSDFAASKGAEVALAGEGDVTRGSSIDGSATFASSSIASVDFCGTGVAVATAGVDLEKAAKRESDFFVGEASSTFLTF
jgi:hypothetical protein